MSSRNSATGHLSPEAVVVALREQGSISAASRVLGVNRNTLDSYVHRELIDLSNGVANAQVFGKPVETVVTEENLGDIQKLIRKRGLEPKDYAVSNIRLNEWGACTTCGTAQEQNRVDLRPRKDLLVPVRSDGWKPPKTGKVKSASGRIVYFPDLHCPSFDPVVVQASYDFIREAKPEVIIFGGDGMDNASASRHRRMGNEAPLQECAQSFYSVVRGAVDAVVRAGMRVGSKPGECRVVVLPGNHDEDRIRNALRDKGTGEVADFKGMWDHPLLSMRHYMRFDELSVETISPPAGYGYDHAEVRVSDNLLAVHGWIAKEGSGRSALATLEKVNENVGQGHTHRQALVFKTVWEKGVAKRLTAFEAGTMSLVEQSSLGYANRPDWQAGWAVIEDYGDGITVDFATRVGDRVLWRGNAFSV